MSGNGGGSTTTQKADPWIGVQPGLYNLYNNAAAQFAQGGPSVYQGSGVQPLNANQTGNLEALAQIGSGGIGNLNPAQAQALSTAQGITAGTDAQSQNINNIATGNDASGQYLKSLLNPSYVSSGATDPALQAYLDAANSNTTRNFTNTVMPGINSTFSSAGRFGSGAQNVQAGNATNNLATQISNTNAGITYQDLAARRAQQLQAGLGLGSQMLSGSNLGSARQFGALQALPGLSLQGVQNANIGLMAGGQQQQQQQQELTDYINRYNANQQQPYNNLNWYAQILAGGNPLASQTQQTTGQQSSGLQRAGTGALSGAATGAAIGSVVPGIGTAIGAGVGAIGGGLLGIL